MIRLPPDDFATIAADLFAVASREAIGNEGLAVFVAANPRPGLVDNLRQCERMADVVGRLHDFFRQAAPFEAEVRAFVDDLARRAPCEAAA